MRNSELLYKLDCIFVGANFVRPQAFPSGEGGPTEGLVDEENINEFVL